MQLFLWVKHELAILELHVSILLSFVIGVIPQNLLDYYCWSIGSQIDCRLADWQIFSNKNIIILTVSQLLASAVCTLSV